MLKLKNESSLGLITVPINYQILYRLTPQIHRQKLLRNRENVAHIDSLIAIYRQFERNVFSQQNGSKLFAILMLITDMLYEIFVFVVQTHHRMPFFASVLHLLSRIA